jgi:hypothetical protein
VISDNGRGFDAKVKKEREVFVIYVSEQKNATVNFIKKGGTIITIIIPIEQN